MRTFHLAAALAGLFLLSSAPADADSAPPDSATGAPPANPSVAAPGNTASAPSDVTVDTKELMVPGPLGEKALGDPKAPVTVVEYASMTCPHCGRFYATTFDALKKRYIDTGKVYFIFREFPLDPLSTAAFMAARCAPADRYFEVIDALFKEQENWAFVDNPGPPLLKLLQAKGFDEQSFKACLADQKILDGVNVVAIRGSEKFGVNGTPTFFINGHKRVGALTIEEVDQIIEPML